ncbi:MAG: PAC2 family protein [Planctomycetota bacterium]
MDRSPQAPWLVAAWPGMGSVAVLAAQTLVKALGAKKVSEVPTRAFFEIERVHAYHGLIQPPRYPRATIYGWENPAGPDVYVFIGEAQPTAHGYMLCESLIDRALELGVERIATFAAMATPTHPRSDARVFAVATDEELLAAAQRPGVLPLDEGAISGLNGILLAAGRARELPGLCLLGEFPFFASAIPQPKAAAAVLRTFGQLVGVELDLHELDERARALEEQLVGLLEHLHEAAGVELVAEGEAPPVPNVKAPEAPEPEPELAEPSAVARLDPAVLAHIEALFAEAEKDRKQALELKALLDQHGVFEEFEDRFLDLFKQGE